MSIREEKENKFLLRKFPADAKWEKKVLIYQFFAERHADRNRQLKIIFHLSTHQVNVCTVEKKILSPTESIKKTDYIAVEELRLKDLIGMPFVMKKRYIKSPHYLDCYLVSNQICRYILEVEHEYLMDSLMQLYNIDRNVSEETEYLNENMTTEFDAGQYETLQLLLAIFTDYYPPHYLH